MSAAHGVSDSLAGLAAAMVLLEDPGDLEDTGRAFAMVVEDMAYLGRRTADAIERTPLNPATLMAFEVVASGLHRAAAIADENLNFGLVTGRR